MERTVAIVGPGPKFLSGIAYYTWRLHSAIGATPILFRDMMPLILFPGRSHVRKEQPRSKIKYEPHGSFLDWWNPITWFLAVRKINRHDVVIIEWWSSSVAHMYAFILAFCKAKVLIELHETLDPLETSIWPIAAYAKVMRRYIFSKADCIVTHTVKDQSVFSDTYKNISVIPHGLYDQYRKLDIKMAGDPFNILFFGLVREYKGVNYLIDAFKRANIPNSCLWIVGEQWDPIKQQTDKEKKIYVINHYAVDDEIEMMFSYADVLVLPYLRASSSGPAHIAMAMGLPIIATTEGGLGELADYKGMFYVRTKDSDHIAERLREIVYHHRKERFKPPVRLTWDVVSEQWKKLIQTL